MAYRSRMSMRFLECGLCLLFLVVTVGGGCSGPSDSPPDASAQEPVAQPVPSEQSGGWELRDSAKYNITSMDPAKIIDAFSLNVLGHVYDGLVRMDAGRGSPAGTGRELGRDGRWESNGHSI